jgi:hypothetical protein
MGFAFGYHTAWLKSMRTLQIDFAARGVDIKPQLIIAKREEQVFD